MNVPVSCVADGVADAARFSAIGGLICSSARAAFEESTVRSNGPLLCSAEGFWTVGADRLGCGRSRRAADMRPGR